MSKRARKLAFYALCAAVAVPLGEVLDPYEPVSFYAGVAVVCVVLLVPGMLWIGRAPDARARARAEHGRGTG